MSEGTKTGIFAGVAAVAVLLAVAMSWSGSQASSTPDQEIGGELFKDFQDPGKATSLEIVKYDPETSELRDFRVAKVDGVWTIPSHYDYPADAAEHLAKAATSVMGLKKLNVVSDDKNSHTTYGVIEPDSKTLAGGDEGVGSLVALSDDGGNKLAQLVIGKEVKDKPELRYVRIPGQDRVYTVKLSTDDLSTDFADWIEDDLLKLNSFDIEGVKIVDYSINELEGTRSELDMIQLNYDDSASDAKWTMVDLPEGDKLNETKLNDMKNALDDLKIVDVRRKPEGLRRLLAGESDRLSPQDVISLQQHGFFLANGALLSSEGEVGVEMKDGVLYELRFGRLAAKTAEQKEKEKKEGDTPAEETGTAENADGDAEGSGLNRYIFVLARFDESLLEKPELEQLPGESPAPAEKPEIDKPADDKPADDKPADDPASEDADEAAADDAALNADNADAADTKDDEKAAGPDAGKAEVDAEALKIEREQIEKENQRKMDEYQEKVKKGQEHAKELNDRFADWYYVISDEVYRKIHLSRNEIIEKPEPAEGEDSPKSPADELEAIKNQGLKP